MDAMRRVLWEEGRLERGREPEAPFVGCPLAELEMEYLDALNYLEEGARQRGFPADPERWPEGWRWAWAATRELCEWTRRQLAEAPSLHR